MVVRGGSHFYQSPKSVYVCVCVGGGGGGSGVLLIKT